MSAWYEGTTSRLTATFVSASGSLQDATAVSVRILRRDGAAALAATNVLANRSAVGTYYYDWTPESPGTYVVIFTATVGERQELVTYGVRIYSRFDALLTALSAAWVEGNTGRITVTLTGAATVVTITIYDARSQDTDNPVLAETSILTNNPGVAQYYVDWTPVSAGTYLAWVVATVGGKQETQALKFRVEDILTAV